MKVRIPTARKNGRSGEIHGASARRPLPLGADAEVFPPAEVRDLRGRPLPVVYMPLLGFLVMIAAVYGLVVNDAYRLVSFLTRETWRAQDAVTLATVPVLLWATWRARAGSLSAHLVSVGIMIWLTYGYAHLSMGAPFSAMFLVYVSVLTLAGFCLPVRDFLLSQAEVSLTGYPSHVTKSGVKCRGQHQRNRSLKCQRERIHHGTQRTGCGRISTGRLEMTKSKSVIFSILWAVVVIAFPVASGVIVVVSKADPTASRLIQAAFMYASISIPLVYCKVKKIALKETLLTGIDKEGVKTCLFYLPLVAILLPMIVSGVDLSDTGYVLATLLFTLGVGIAEELYFRGIILRLLGKSFGPVQVVFISMLIFGIDHASGAFVETSMVMVSLSILNAFLFGWIAAETALITKNIIPLMIFHCLFDFFTYQMLATGNAMIVIYAVRGTLMTIVAVYLLIKLKQQTINEQPRSLTSKSS
jgi:membrane protease YdiL (CAAX protease family)